MKPSQFGVCVSRFDVPGLIVRLGVFVSGRESSLVVCPV